MSTSNLPPLRILPRWSGVRDLDRVRYPRLLSSDCTVRCPSVNIKSPKAAARPCVDEDGKRITSLQKDILFLQHQHKDMLERLHAEVEHLKRVNKDLQYQLVMEHQLSPKDSIRSTSSSSKSSSQEKNSQCRSISSEEVREEAAITCLLPLRITCSPSQHPRTPTLSECEVIIRQLHHANISQYQELVQVKNILRDIVLNKKNSSAAAVSLARDCLCDKTRTDAYQHFPKLPLKPLPKKLHPGQRNVGETVEKFLPAIKHNFISTMSERQRKAQDVHKMRFRRTVNS